MTSVCGLRHPRRVDCSFAYTGATGCVTRKSLANAVGPCLIYCFEEARGMPAAVFARVVNLEPLPRHGVACTGCFGRRHCLRRELREEEEEEEERSCDVWLTPFPAAALRRAGWRGCALTIALLHLSPRCYLQLRTVSLPRFFPFCCPSLRWQ